jgi:hypothetical protein
MDSGYLSQVTKPFKTGHGTLDTGHGSLWHIQQQERMAVALGLDRIAAGTFTNLQQKQDCTISGLRPQISEDSTHRIET